jgi:hypothetical protein
MYDFLGLGWIVLEFLGIARGSVAEVGLVLGIRTYNGVQKFTCVSLHTMAWADKTSPDSAMQADVRLDLFLNGRTATLENK